MWQAMPDLDRLRQPAIRICMHSVWTLTRRPCFRIMRRISPPLTLKNVGNSLYRAINLDLEGNLEYGTTEVLGFAEGGVELVKDAHYEEMLPENIRTTLDELEQKIISGEIVVDTAIER